MLRSVYRRLRAGSQNNLTKVAIPSLQQVFHDLGKHQMCFHRSQLEWCDMEQDLCNLRDLVEIYKAYSAPDGEGDKGTAHSYIEIYEELLAPYRSSATAILEIGVARGLSVSMWLEYFDKAVIYGVDITTPHQICNPRYVHIQADATSSQLLAHLGNVRLDIVIDDGDHRLESQLASYALLSPFLSSCGIYIIEDVIDPDRARHAFAHANHGRSVEIMDRRTLKQRVDDVLLILR